MNRPNKEIRRISRENLNGRYGTAMGAMIIVNLLPTVILIPFALLLSGTSVFENIIYYLASFAISLLTMILSAGDFYLHLNIGRGRPFLVSDVFHCFKARPDAYILAYLLLIVKLIPYMIPALLLLIVAAVIQSIPLLLLGIIAYIVGFVFMIITALRYSQIFLILVDNPYQKLKDVFAKSRDLMNGRKKQLFCLELSFIGLFLLGILSFGIGLLWVTPYYTQSTINFYRDAIGDISFEAAA